MTHDELRDKLLRIRRISLDIFIGLMAVLLILSGVTRILGIRILESMWILILELKKLAADVILQSMPS